MLLFGCRRHAGAPRLLSRAAFLAWLLLALNGGRLGADPGVVLNELLTRSPRGLGVLEYVELWNSGKEPLDLSGWSLASGVRYQFAEGTRLEPGSFLVVCRDLAAFQKAYGTEVKALGNLKGKLSREGERVDLLDREKKPADSVHYAKGGDWPLGPSSGRSSLERISPGAPGRLPQNWGPSRPAAEGRAPGTPGRRNDCFSPGLPPLVEEVKVSPRSPAPGQEVKVEASVQSAAGVKAVFLLHRGLEGGREGEERETPMARVSGDAKAGTYTAAIDGKPDRTLVRFRIKALDSEGAVRVDPPENEPRPTRSYYVFGGTEKAGIPLGFLITTAPREAAPPAKPAGRRFGFGGRGWFGLGPRGPGPAQPSQPGALVYVPPGGEPETFDHVRISQRKGGFKVRFHPDRTFRGMTIINAIFEYEPRFILAEPLSYELYRLAGVPAPLTEHLRLWQDGRLLGYHLLVEQPNRSFLERNGRDAGGNLYKLLWYGQGVVEKHEKKTHASGGHQDLLQLLQGLSRTSGEEQWRLIQESFNVEEVAGYFAVNMCISNWDGFFNNYFAYHDLRPGGKWELIPWDEDKTWGDHDGAPPDRSWYDMPLSFGMDGDQPPAGRRRGPFGGAGWWRPPGYFSGPLLANAGFRRVFLERLKRICRETFTEEKLGPLIDGLESRLGPEVEVRARAVGEDPRGAREAFRRDIRSFRAQVLHRREFLLAQPELKG